MSQISLEPSQASRILGYVAEVICCERNALERLENSLGAEVSLAIDALLKVHGHIVVSGVGKAGLIGRKIAATLSSTGSPAIFLHPTEACHGDLGAVRPKDALLAISASGESSELIDAVAASKRLGLRVVSLTGEKASTLARLSDWVIDVGVDREADPFNTAPTASTTAMLAMGDAIAITLMRLRGFTKERFSALHPAGAIGRSLVWRVADLMHTGARMPVVAPEATISEAILEMTQKRLGATFVVDPSGRLAGVFTDGDLRRFLHNHPEPLGLTVNMAMTSSPQVVAETELAASALELMENRAITVLPVLNDEGSLVGALHLHDIVQAGIR